MLNEPISNSSDNEEIVTPTKATISAKRRYKKVLPTQVSIGQHMEEEPSKQPKADGYVEVYKYICAQQDKLFGIRESMINRLGSVRLYAGFLLSVLALSFPVVTKDIEASHNLHNRLLVFLIMLTLLFAISYIVVALLCIPKLIGQVDMGVPGVDTKALKDSLADEELNLIDVVRSLSESYLISIEKNKGYNKDAGDALLKATKYLRKALFCTIGSVFLTIAIYILLSWSSSLKTPLLAAHVTIAKDIPRATSRPKPAQSSVASGTTRTTTSPAITSTSR